MYAFSFALTNLNNETLLKIIDVVVNLLICTAQINTRKYEKFKFNLYYVGSVLHCCLVFGW